MGTLIRGSSGAGSTGSAEPVNFGRRVLEPVNFLGRKTEKDGNLDVYLHRCFLSFKLSLKLKMIEEKDNFGYLKMGCWGIWALKKISEPVNLKPQRSPCMALLIFYIFQKFY